MNKKHSFSPIYNEESNILILGTMPSIRSNEVGFYYMHPQNRFWRVLSKVYDFDFYTASKSDKIEQLLKNKLALFDIIKECDIYLSSDATISNVKPQDIRSILENSKIKKIILNGKKAYSIFMNTYPDLMDIAVCAPSTSSANARLSLEDLTKIWKELLIK